jgi:hypothetical protein
MRRSLILLLVAASFSCGKNPAQPAANPILVQGVDMSAASENISLSRNGAPLTGAQVKVNDTTLSEVNPGLYRGELPALLPPGAQIKVEVRAGSDVVTGVTKIPVIPIMTTPVAGASVHPGTPLAFAWTDTLSPDEFEMVLQWVLGDAGTGESVFVTSSARSGSVTTSAVPAGATELTASLFAFGNGTFTGPVDPASKMHVRQESLTIPLVLVF